MIEKHVEEKHIWKINDEDNAFYARVMVDSGEILIDIQYEGIETIGSNIALVSPDLDRARDLHKALGEAIKIAEEQQ